MTPREIFDRALAAVNAGDADALLALYAPDAVQVGLDQVVRGRDALRDGVQAWLAGSPRVREVAFAAAEDTLVYEAETDEGRGYGTMVLRDGLIWRETLGAFPAQPAVPAS